MAPKSNAAEAAEAKAAKAADQAKAAKAAKAAKVADQAKADADAEAAKSDKGQTSVAWQGGVRTYTKELHGSDHAKLAKEFAAKKNGTIV